MDVVVAVSSLQPTIVRTLPHTLLQWIVDDKIFTVVFSYTFHHFYSGLLQRLHFQSQGICKSGTETVG